MTFFLSKTNRPFLKKINIDTLEELAEFTSAWERSAKKSSRETGITPSVKVRFFKQPISKYRLADVIEIEGPFDGEIRLSTELETKENETWEILPHEIYC